MATRFFYPYVPKWRVAITVPSEYDRPHTVYRISDGTYACDCLSFLLQRETDSHGRCMHIRIAQSDPDMRKKMSSEDPEHRRIPPLDDQILILESLGLKDNEKGGEEEDRLGLGLGLIQPQPPAGGDTLERKITYAQAYFITHTLLKKQGMGYKQYRKLLKTFGTVKTIPLLNFGVEFEFYTKSREELVSKLNATGIPCEETGYTGNKPPAPNWRLGTDASIDDTSVGGYEPCELVSPKLSGVDGLQELVKALHIVNDVGAKVNAACGFHVHVDACGIDEARFLPRLAKAWARIEIPLLWYLVSPSRRGNRFCEPVNEYYLEQVSQGYLTNRYHSLNIASIERHGTVEFRLHQGTTNPDKVVSWVILCLMLFNSIKQGLSFYGHKRKFTDFNYVMNIIGVSEKGAVPAIVEAREYLYKRYCFWRQDAERHPEHVPWISPPRIP